MASESAQSPSQQNPASPGDPRTARIAILAAARTVHRRDGAAGITLAAVAKEAGVKADAVSAHFQTPQEILVALAADDLAAVARASEQAAKTEMPPQPTSLRKKPILPSQLEQVMADVAPNGGKDVATGAMARLERRMQVIEKAVTDVADRQEKQVRDRSNAISSVEESITAMLTRMDVSEKQNAALVDGLRSAVSKVTSRLTVLETPAPTPVAAPAPVSTATLAADIAPEPKSSLTAPKQSLALETPALATPADTTSATLAPLSASSAETKSDTTSAELSTLPSLDTLIAAPKEKLGQAPEVKPASLEDSYLTNARRAALAAAEKESEKAKSLADSRARNTSRGKFLLFACLAPVVIMGTAIMVLNRNAVTAEPAPIAEAPAAPQTVVAALEQPPAITAPVPVEPATSAPAQTPETTQAPEPAQTPQATAPDPVAPAPQTQTSPPNATPQTAAAPELPSVLSRASIADLTKSAAAGDVRAMRDAGLKYLAGDGVAADETEAARWLLRASYKGEPIAEYWLATLYVRGRGVPADAFQANHWFEAAAKQGNRSAMHNLALNKWQGIGGDKNDEQAARWFKAAAELGYVDSEFNLAVLYERGQGVPQNFTEAYMWYAVAAARGDKESENRLVVLATHMQPADLAAGQAAAAAFKPKPMDQTANLIAAAPSSGG